MTDALMTEQDLKDYLTEILIFMNSSADSFDNRCVGEARRLAACIRILAEDTAQSRSLLGQLGLTNLFFYDDAPDYNPELGLPFSGLAVVTLGGKTHKYAARLDNNVRSKTRKVSFDQWWHKPVIVDEKRKMSLTRRDVTLAVASANIGEINPKLTGAFEELLRKESRGWITDSTVVPLDMIEIEYASLRQIAFELLNSLEDQLK
ncbi:MAG: hypothetical protein HZB82_07690 [Deltaproteobacteria bacterium]|nr:hypothetical protein [Deltaproteobacteria bacterium]